MKSNHFFRHRTLFLALSLLILIGGDALLACTVTVISAQSERMLAANYDFAYGHGLIVINPRDLRKQSLHDRPEDLFEWTAQYGSVTFNQFGRELPTGGMNEAGLSIELLWQDDGQLPQPGRNGNLNELQWIQYQLDTQATIDDVVRGIQQSPLQLHTRTTEPGIRISYVPLHYFLCDATDECAIVEFVNGRTEIFRRDDLPVAALSNASYRQSLAYRSTLQKSGQDFDRRVSPLGRFTMAAYRNSLHASGIDSASEAVQNAFASLRQFSIQPGFGDLFAYLFRGQAPAFTQWSLIYRPQSKIIHLRTRSNPAERMIHLTHLDFRCKAGAMIQDIETGNGDISRNFVPYTRTENERIIRLSYAPVADVFPPEAQRAITAYPESSRCLER